MFVLLINVFQEEPDMPVAVEIDAVSVVVCGSGIRYRIEIIATGQAIQFLRLCMVKSCLLAQVGNIRPVGTGGPAAVR